MELNSTFKSYLSVYEKLKIARETTILETTKNRINYYSNALEYYIKAIHFIEPLKQGLNQLEEIEKGVLSTALYENVVNHLTEYRRLEDDLSKPFKIFIVGSGNYGKSTLINSLLGVDYAKTDTVPKTWKIDVYNKTTQSHQVQLHYKDGTTKTVYKEEAERIIESEEQKVEEANRAIRKLLRTARREKKFEDAHAADEYKVKLTNELGYTPSINEVHWGVPNNGILDNLILVDTPGLDQKNYSGEVINNIETFSDKSDGIIWMLDATSIDARINDTALLNNLLDSLDQQKNVVQRNNIIAVINKIDLIASSEEEKEAVIEKANDSYKNQFAKIIPYSALMAFEGNKFDDEKLKEASGYNALLDVIENVFLKNSTVIQTNRVNQSSIKYNQRILKRVTEYDEQLMKDYNKYVEGYEATIEAFERTTQSLVADFDQYLQNEYNRIRPKLSMNLDALQNFKTEEKKSYHIRENIYQEKIVKGAFEGFVTHAEKEANKLSENTLRKYMITQYKHLDTYKKLPKIPTPQFEHKIETGEIYMPKVMNSVAIGGAIGMIFGGVGAAIGASLGGLFSSWARDDQIREIENSVIEYYNQLVDVYANLIYEYLEEVRNLMINNLFLSFANVYNLTSFVDDENFFELVDELFIQNEELIHQYGDQAIAFNVPLPEIILTH